MIKILIVEDEKPIRNLIDMQLTSSGYHCQTAEDGMIAADLIEAKSFDLILLDIMLPGVTGFELMEYIRHAGYFHYSKTRGSRPRERFTPRCG